MYYLEDDEDPRIGKGAEPVTSCWCLRGRIDHVSIVHGSASIATCFLTVVQHAQNALLSVGGDAISGTGAVSIPSVNGPAQGSVTTR